MNERNFKQFKDLQKTLRTILKDKAKVKEVLEKGIDYVKELIDGVSIENIKIAWNYEEINRTKYDFEDSIKWIKNNLPENSKKNIKGCIYLIERLNDEQNYKILLCYIIDKEPILNG